MYEILLGSKGIMQLGWATLRCKFTNEVHVHACQTSSKMRLLCYILLESIWNTKGVS